MGEPCPRREALETAHRVPMDDPLASASGVIPLPLTRSSLCQIVAVGDGIWLREGKNFPRPREDYFRGEKILF